MKKMLTVLASAAILAVPFAGPAAADSGICEIGVIVHEGPSYSLDPSRPYVETGTYEPYQNCTSEPPIIISRDPICLQKPSICV